VKYKNLSLMIDTENLISVSSLHDLEVDFFEWAVNQTSLPDKPFADCRHEDHWVSRQDRP